MRDDRWLSRSAAQGLWAALFALAWLAALSLELVVERGAPLWLDEAWTIAIVGQRSWISFYHQVYWDVNAPLYYLVMHVWQAAFGLSDLSLRVPSLICAAATPLVLALSRVGGLPAEERLTWAGVMALWFPALSFAQEARCYAMLLLVSTLQCLAFIRLAAKPDTGRAALWAGLTAVSILTHYDALFVGAAQGALYLLVHRMRAVRTWPAAFALAPAFGWLIHHLPRIAEFARPDIAWYAPLHWSNLWEVLGFLAGRQGELWALLIVSGEAVALRFIWPARHRQGARIGDLVWLAVLASLVSATALTTIGFFRPSFAIRYLTPDAPGLLLGVVLVIRMLAGPRTWPAFVGLIASYAVVSGAVLLHGLRMAPGVYNYERASEFLERARPERLVFLWDHPVDPILHADQLDAAGGAFFRRDGVPIVVDPVVLRRGENPNTRLLAGARPSRSAILWIYDNVVHGTAAIAYPPAIDKLDPSWRCRAFGGGRFGVYACDRRGGAAS